MLGPGSSPYSEPLVTETYADAAIYWPGAL